MTQSCVKNTLTALLLFSAVISAQEPSRFMVFEDLRPLILYNGYEQQLSPNDKEMIPPYSAFLIQKDRIMLSDNFSIARLLKGDGAHFFLLLDEHGKIKNLEHAGKVQIFENTQRLSDTLVVNRPNTVYIRDPIKNERYRTLEKNDLLYRIFRYKNREYVKLLKLPVFGWLDAVDRSALERFKSSKTSTGGFSESDILQVRRSIERINAQIADVFDMLNKKTGQSHVAPQWKISLSDDKIECFIDGYQNEFEQTGVQLQKELRRYIRQKELRVSGSPDHFTIVIIN